jgi:hypothetical protein
MVAIVGSGVVVSGFVASGLVEVAGVVGSGVEAADLSRGAVVNKLSNTVLGAMLFFAKRASYAAVNC